MSIAPTDRSSPSPTATAAEAPLLRLTKALRGYARYVIVVDPTEEMQYSVGMRHVLDTEGGRAILVALRKNVFRTHKRHLQQRLCLSVVEGRPCPDGQQCLHIHVTPEGYADRRMWVDPTHRPCQTPDPIANATVAQSPSHPVDHPSPLRLTPTLPHPPVPSNTGSQFSAPAHEFRPSGLYLPSMYLTAPLPPPAAAHLTPRRHGAVPPSSHDDRTVAQQRASQLRCRVRSDVDRTLAQNQPASPLSGGSPVFVSPLGPPMSFAGGYPYNQGLSPDFPTAGPYATSSPYDHHIPAADHYSVPYPLWVAPPPHMGSW